MREKCKNNKEAQADRPYTSDTAYLIKKYYKEYTDKGISHDKAIEKIATALVRSKENVLLAFDAEKENGMILTLGEWIIVFANQKEIAHISINWYNGEHGKYVLDEEYSIGDNIEYFVEDCKDYPFMLEMPMYKFHEIVFDTKTHELELTYYND